MESADVVVVGGGVMGLSVAWRLAGERNVLLLERATLGNPEGSSHGPSRIFRFVYDDPLYVRMAMEALPLWRELGGEIVHITGGLDLGDDVLLERCRAALESTGARAEMLGADQRRERFEWLEASNAPALFSPDTGVIEAAEAVRALAAAARDAGAELREEALVVSLTPDEDAVTLQTDAGTLRARRVVIAAGAWTGPLARAAGIATPLRVTQEQVFYYDAKHAVVPVIFRDLPLRYVVPQVNGALGVKVGEHIAGKETTATDRTFQIDEMGRARVDGFVAQTFPRFGARVGQETCLYTNTPDEDFVVDTRGPLVVLSPCSGHGFKFAPLIGEIAARLVTGREPPVDLSRFSLSRFAEGAR